MLSTNAAKSYFNFFFTSFVDYCRENKATVDVERKEKVEDIADTLKRLKIFSSAASGEQQNWFTPAVKKESDKPQAAQAHVSSQRLIYERVTSCVTRC